MNANAGGGSPGGKREHLGILFRCCNTYGYIYKNKAGAKYSGFCPRCMRRAEVKISINGAGSDQRIFEFG